MATDADIALYDSEMVGAFQRKKSFLRETTTTRGTEKGGTFIFDVYGDRADTAVSRGANGDIPYAGTSQSQVTLTMEEWHAAKEKNNFNIFKGQADQKRTMQEEVVYIANRKMDAQIITALEAATTVNTVAVSATYDFVMAAIVNLAQNDAGEGKITAVITPAFFGNLGKIKEFSSADFVDSKMFSAKPMERKFMWCGIEWIIHTGLTGMGTAAETCFMYNSAAIGHALGNGTVKHEADYEAKHDRSWARSTFYGGGKLLQNSGVIKLSHLGTGFTIS
jgi:hypothetical protein